MVYGVSNRKEEFHNDEMDHRYVKHPKDKHQLIIDPDAAEIVKLIFSLFLKGTSKRELAKISRYKQSLYQDWNDGEITQQDYRDTYFAEILQHPAIGRNFIRTKSVQSFQLARRPGTVSYTHL